MVGIVSVALEGYRPCSGEVQQSNDEENLLLLFYFIFTPFCYISTSDEIKIASFKMFKNWPKTAFCRYTKEKNPGIVIHLARLFTFKILNDVIVDVRLCSLAE